MATKNYYQAELSHSGLNKFRIVKAASRDELNKKIATIKADWESQWAKKVEQQNKKAERELKIKNDEESLRYANEKTREAEELQSALDKMVINRKVPLALNPDDYKDYSAFSEKKPDVPVLTDVPRAPASTDTKYNPSIPFFTKLSKKKKSQFIANNQYAFEQDYHVWEENKKRIDELNEKLTNDYNRAMEEWDKRNNAFLEAQREDNSAIDELFEKYANGDEKAIGHYYALLLGRIQFPFDYCIQAEAEYTHENKRLIIDLLLPNIESIPNIKSISYIKSRKEFKQSLYSDAYIRKKYDSVLYQIVLMCLDTVFSFGKKNGHVDYVVLNGIVKTIDKATGKEISPCVLTVAIERNDFENINIDAVDPKTWFKSTKGISAASLAAVTPVAPIVSISREDSRFVEAYGVVDQIDEGVNLAAIDWQDFENLIRELFEKEFSVNGGEVKITQASRDGGVDAIAFDPDPIRGGKIVIQAKRYTNVVGVSAVRDLYGTVLNEGATKGILVTTSNYGNDSYAFAQGKPLTLLNGANLLYLLNKHGYEARINLAEAKELQK